MPAPPTIDVARQELETASARLGKLFAGKGYRPIAPPHLYPGETLLGLYGEDLRARAFLFPDAERGAELCLRPDFTVPVALAHGAADWRSARAYCYQGPIFRRQPPGLERPIEYRQAGVERFGDGDAAEADAAVLALMLDGLAALGCRDLAITVGDLSIPFALLDALEMPARRRAALRRHFWRPARFQDLLTRAVAPPPPGESRRALLEIAGSSNADQALRSLVRDAGETFGARGCDEILVRLDRLARAERDAPMPGRDARLVDAMLGVEGSAPDALARMRRLAEDFGVDVRSALDRFEARLDALAARGVEPSRLAFDADFGRNLEYYDGFVFEIRARGRSGHPPLAGGGRYDAMTVELGAAAPVPAVGGMIRPEAALEACA